MTHPQERTKEVPTENIKRLSVQISLTGLSFLLEYPSGDTWTHRHELPSGLHPGDVLTELQQILTQDRFQSKTQEVVVVYHHPTFTFVPEALFDPNNLADYLKFNAKILAQDYLDYDVSKSRGMVNVYIPYTNINNFFFDRYGDFTFLHSATVYLAALEAQHTSATTQVAAHLEDNSLLIAVTSGKKVHLINAFAISGTEDFAYYLLFTMEQLGLDPKEIPLMLSGNIDEQDEYFALGYRYVKDINILKDSQNAFLLKNVAACE
ncbi:DUF3822 family protein [Gilvibacter sediminis]|uniref:DUF3822 family protein n=1 Tax=Gilvibacter sediminis TaxID=379071 RepID=UPI002350E8B5|nr:DUF3822 family protein [Gilvibacter sediminis]MDC7997739.1 DUF3822 family protein [Gilvibacter sediminis]